MSLVTQARITYGLGVLSVVAVVVSHLALTDIRHGKQDVALEWAALRTAFAAIVVFQISALVTLRLVVHAGRT
jgi:hypothetical protein